MFFDIIDDIILISGKGGDKFVKKKNKEICFYIRIYSKFRSNDF